MIALLGACLPQLTLLLLCSQRRWNGQSLQEATITQTTIKRLEAMAVDISCFLLLLCLFPLLSLADYTCNFQNDKCPLCITSDIVFNRHRWRQIASFSPQHGSIASTACFNGIQHCETFTASEIQAWDELKVRLETRDKLDGSDPVAWTAKIPSERPFSAKIWHYKLKS